MMNKMIWIAADNDLTFMIKKKEDLSEEESHKRIKSYIDNMASKYYDDIYEFLVMPMYTLMPNNSTLLIRLDINPLEVRLVEISGEGSRFTKLPSLDWQEGIGDFRREYLNQLMVHLDEVASGERVPFSIRGTIVSEGNNVLH